jgi:hypothetical protein
VTPCVRGLWWNHPISCKRYEHDWSSMSPTSPKLYVWFWVCVWVCLHILRVTTRVRTICGGESVHRHQTLNHPIHLSHFPRTDIKRLEPRRYISKRHGIVFFLIYTLCLTGSHGEFLIGFSKRFVVWMCGWLWEFALGGDSDLFTMVVSR